MLVGIKPETFTTIHATATINAAILMSIIFVYYLIPRFSLAEITHKNKSSPYLSSRLIHRTTAATRPQPNDRAFKRDILSILVVPTVHNILIPICLQKLKTLGTKWMIDWFLTRGIKRKFSLSQKKTTKEAPFTKTSTFIWIERSVAASPNNIKIDNNR